MQTDVIKYSDIFDARKFGINFITFFSLFIGFFLTTAVITIGLDNLVGFRFLAHRLFDFLLFSLFNIFLFTLSLCIMSWLLRNDISILFATPIITILGFVMMWCVLFKKPFVNIAPYIFPLLLSFLSITAGLIFSVRASSLNISRLIVIIILSELLAQIISHIAYAVFEGKTGVWSVFPVPLYKDIVTTFIITLLLGAAKGTVYYYSLLGTPFFKRGTVVAKYSADSVTPIIRTAQNTDIPDQIKKLADLKEQGILTEDEFLVKKRQLLDKM